MRPIIALATLAATATYVYAQRADGTMNGNGVAQSPPAPGDKPTHDLPSGFSAFVAEGAVPQRGCPPSAHEPYPAQGIPQPGKEGRGKIEIIPDQQRTFRPECVDIFVPTDQGGTRISVGGKSLADTLTLDRKARVWWDYAREIDSVTSRLLNVGKTTLLVPTDGVILSLSRKPHQNRAGETSDEDAQTNTERFIAAHIIPDFDGRKTDGAVKNLLGDDIEIVEDIFRGEGLFVRPGMFEVVGISEANNGRILYINGLLPFRA